MSTAAREYLAILWGGLQFATVTSLTIARNSSYFQGLAGQLVIDRAGVHEHWGSGHDDLGSRLGHDFFYWSQVEPGYGDAGFVIQTGDLVCGYVEPQADDRQRFSRWCQCSEHFQLLTRIIRGEAESSEAALEALPPGTTLDSYGAVRPGYREFAGLVLTDDLDPYIRSYNERHNLEAPGVIELRYLKELEPAWWTAFRDQTDYDEQVEIAANECTPERPCFFCASYLPRP